MKITELKKHLKNSTKEQLISDIADLFKKNDFVNDYFRSKYGDDNSHLILIKYKAIIENEFFPSKGNGKARLSVAKKAITEFKKISSDKSLIAELMLFYVENGVHYTDCYGDINEQFYLSMESMYEQTLDLITDNNLVDTFKDRCLKILNDTADMGWGFHDQLDDIYCNHIEPCGGQTSIISNLTHFLDEKGNIPNLPEPAMKLIRFLTKIVSNASIDIKEPIVDVDLKCSDRSETVNCEGYIEAWCNENMDIVWHCNTCDVRGAVSNWQGTQWDNNK